MGVLDGVKVLEVAEHGFVPSAAAILAEWGADVVKVERPTGDPLRQIMAMGFVADTGDFNFLFEQFNRNKRGVALDLRNDEGRRALDGLIEWADVYITNFLPSARDKLRLNPQNIWAVNPKCVYAIGSGQGLEGPDADKGGFDAVSYWARGGLADMLTAQGAPLVQPRGALGDAPSGAFLAGGVAAALFKRERTGEPTIVDVALLGAAVWTLSNDLVPTTILGQEPPRHVAGKSLGSVLVGSYRTADERWLSLNMLDPERHWAPTCTALGLEELVGRPEYETAAMRAQAVSTLHPIFTERIASLTLADLKTRLSAQDTIYSAIASPVEVVDDPQVHANGFMVKHPDHPRARLSSSPMQFDGAGLKIRRGAPAIGEHTDEVFTEIGMAPDEIARLRAAGALRARSPVPQPRMIWGVGLNYRDHAEETGRPLPDAPTLFVKSPSSVIGNGETIVIPPHVTEPDYEGELAVVIGERARDVSQADALHIIAGVTVGHDVSSRDHQFTTGQWSWSKSFDTFCALGPEVVSLDEIDLARGLAIRTTVSGEVLQDSSTDQLVFSVPELIAWISQGCTMEPGDVILTGTPAGVGAARTPPRWLVDGDVVEITIDGVGTLRNPVVRPEP